MELDRKDIIDKVRQSYMGHGWNCAETTLRILAGNFGINLGEQLLWAAKGMHGAGGYRAQCGLVEGPLMFIGILGKSLGLTDAETAQKCFDFADAFTSRFGSLLCRDLRPGGFNDDDPPHLCTEITIETIGFSSEWVKNTFSLDRMEGCHAQG